MPDAAGELGNRFQCRANIQSSKLERDGLSVTRINYYTHRIIIIISLLIVVNMRKFNIKTFERRRNWRNRENKFKCLHNKGDFIAV